MIKKSQISESKRHLRVSESLKRLLSEGLNQKKILESVIGSRYVTISELRISTDLRLAKIYVTIQEADDQELVIKLLNDNNSYISHYLAKVTNLKSTPKLKFFYDDLSDKINHIDNLFDSLNLEN
jgi:ribosome-binding factor A